MISYELKNIAQRRYRWEIIVDKLQSLIIGKSYRLNKKMAESTTMTTA